MKTRHERTRRGRPKRGHVGNVPHGAGNLDVEHVSNVLIPPGREQRRHCECPL